MDYFTDLLAAFLDVGRGNIIAVYGRVKSDYYRFKTVVLLNIFVETVIDYIFQHSQMNRKFKRTAFI